MVDLPAFGSDDRTHGLGVCTTCLGQAAVQVVVAGPSRLGLGVTQQEQQSTVSHDARA